MAQPLVSISLRAPRAHASCNFTTIASRMLSSLSLAPVLSCKPLWSCSNTSRRLLRERLITTCCVDRGPRRDNAANARFVDAVRFRLGCAKPVICAACSDGMLVTTTAHASCCAVLQTIRGGPAVAALVHDAAKSCEPPRSHASLVALTRGQSTSSRGP